MHARACGKCTEYADGLLKEVLVLVFYLGRFVSVGALLEQGGSVDTTHT